MDLPRERSARDDWIAPYPTPSHVAALMPMLWTDAFGRALAQIVLQTCNWQIHTAFLDEPAPAQLKIPTGAAERCHRG